MTYLHYLEKNLEFLIVKRLKRNNYSENKPAFWFKKWIFRSTGFLQNRNNKIFACFERPQFSGVYSFLPHANAIKNALPSIIILKISYYWNLIYRNFIINKHALVQLHPTQTKRLLYVGP